jgi:DNA-binding response OmpR family regulator
MSEKKKILVIDDDPDIAFFCKTVLDNSIYDVFSAPSANIGITAIKEQTPDLVILDIMMEEADSGFKVAREIADFDPNLPIIMFSSVAAMAEQVGSLPISDLIDKPIQPQHLISKVERLLARKAKK